MICLFIVYRDSKEEPLQENEGTHSSSMLRDLTDRVCVAKIHFCKKAINAPRSCCGAGGYDSHLGALKGSLLESKATVVLLARNARAGFRGCGWILLVVLMQVQSEAVLWR